jgi:hypothetical protein
VSLVAEKSWENEKETTKFTCNSKRDRVLLLRARERQNQRCQKVGGDFQAVIVAAN